MDDSIVDIYNPPESERVYEIVQSTTQSELHSPSSWTKNGWTQINIDPQYEDSVVSILFQGSAVNDNHITGFALSANVIVPEGDVWKDMTNPNPPPSIAHNTLFYLLL